MAKDYKHRTYNRDTNDRQRQRPQNNGGIVRWMLITAIAIGFAVFLVYLKSPDFNKQANQVATTEPSEIKPAEKAETKEEKPQTPQFDFYTILPKKEVIVPDYEVKTRTREEHIGKNKSTLYILQAGSYKDFEEADRLKAKLALMGIESTIQKAKVENVTWYRVKIGPYNQMNNVNSLMSRLQKNGMKPVVTEIEK